MLKLHPDCHNFAKFSSDSCPLVSVCNEDCVYVWKAYYDGTKESEKELKIQDLEYEKEDLEAEIFKLERELGMADDRIIELTNILGGED